MHNNNDECGCIGQYGRQMRLLSKRTKTTKLLSTRARAYEFAKHKNNDEFGS